MRNPRAVKRSTKVAFSTPRAWKLQDAKAHFSQVVREAQQRGPQRVTVHGKGVAVLNPWTDTEPRLPVN